jgi:4-alpha-glucanotransferase
VPEDFRETLADWGLWSYQVMLFERSASGDFRPPESYRENAVVTFATHDLPTYAGWREKRDIGVRQALGMEPGESREQRQAAFDALSEALARRGIEAAGFASVGKFLAETPSRLLIVSMEDLVGVPDQVNLPGTIDNHPNWRRRLPVALEGLNHHDGMLVVAQSMTSAGRGH